MADKTAGIHQSLRIDLLFNPAHEEKRRWSRSPDIQIPLDLSRRVNQRNMTLVLGRLGFELHKARGG